MSSYYYYCRYGRHDIHILACAGRYLMIKKSKQTNKPKQIEKINIVLSRRRCDRQYTAKKTNEQ